ncbi:MAG: 3-isopropylmalate dehydratase small subunit [Candidatus Omnitrophota bacterium]|nr:3-isopropylmalate dehydratase small subunit [Candidatus Omnitrophota bacterium]
MQSFMTHTGIAAPLDRVNVDTDAIVPKQFLRKIERTGFGKHLFHEWRYLDYEGTRENPDFVLNQPRYRKATVLAARDNFGCGSSREHAPWALGDFGFKVIVAPSFADIFYNNCIKNGILPAALKSKEVDEIFVYIKSTPDAKITADLPAQTIIAGTKKYSFSINAFAKECLLKGLDSIGWTIQFSERISAYEEKIKNQRPWLTRK